MFCVVPGRNCFILTTTSITRAFAHSGPLGRVASWSKVPVLRLVAATQCQEVLKSSENLCPNALSCCPLLPRANHWGTNWEVVSSRFVPTTRAAEQVWDFQFTVENVLQFAAIKKPR
jgi:hypothetical protein